MDSSNKIIATFLGNLSEMGPHNNYGGEQKRGFEIVDKVHSPLHEESINDFDQMGSIGKHIGFIVETPLEDMSCSCHGESLIPLYDTTPTNSINEHIFRFESLVSMPFQCFSVWSFVLGFDTTQEDGCNIPNTDIF